MNIHFKQFMMGSIGSGVVKYYVTTCLAVFPLHTIWIATPDRFTPAAILNQFATNYLNVSKSERLKVLKRIGYTWKQNYNNK